MFFKHVTEEKKKLRLKRKIQENAIPRKVFAWIPKLARDGDDSSNIIPIGNIVYNRKTSYGSRYGCCKHHWVWVWLRPIWVTKKYIDMFDIDVTWETCYYFEKPSDGVINEIYKYSMSVLNPSHLAKCSS